MAVIDRLTELTRPTGEEDLLDVSYPAPRLAVTPKQAAVAAAVVVVAVAVWAVWFFQRPDPVEPALAALPEVGHEAADAEETGEIVVSVVGAVEKPGLVTVPQGSRVADALLAALPLLDADVTALNQAQLLVDGQQVHVPARPDSPAHDGAPAPPPAGSGLVSLNSAEAAELTSLDGVGEATAQAIIDHRTSVGGFTALEQLQEVKGIGPAKFEKLKDQVSL
ncbi:ComEA family DNA-binding protein [Corynebacterium sp.]|uniref:ComEA family DNA-binding protein n=1 Tax=Corynebacterium sp. TaxID=1720 RepID=UPI0037352E70